eukprot:TRINITY_DN14347_c0_g1_i1.p1 TRINITY_DN14347_c0_g1~~TRINITY_DN14347_c0_g1_i1.p1  ORF type:complete len:340 (+),score=37.20 TRINITY_DN14347_c0_g1_i1:92-1111(+)
MALVVIQEITNVGRCRTSDNGQVFPEGALGSLQLVQSGGVRRLRWTAASGAVGDDFGTLHNADGGLPANIRVLKQNAQILLLELPGQPRLFFWLPPNAADVAPAIAAFNEQLQLPSQPDSQPTIQPPVQQQSHPSLASSTTVSTSDVAMTDDDDEAAMLEQALALSRGTTGGSTGSAEVSMTGSSNDDDDEEAAMLAQALAMSLNQAPDSKPTPTSSFASGVQLAQLQGILSGMAQYKPEPGLQLADVLSSEAVLPVLRDEPELVELLQDFVPPSQRSTEEVLKTFTSPQWQSALNHFQKVLGTGQLGPLLMAFGIDCSDGTGPTSIEELLQTVISMRR